MNPDGCRSMMEPWMKQMDERMSRMESWMKRMDGTMSRMEQWTRRMAEAQNVLVGFSHEVPLHRMDEVLEGVVSKHPVGMLQADESSVEEDLHSGQDSCAQEELEGENGQTEAYDVLQQVKVTFPGSGEDESRQVTATKNGFSSAQLNGEFGRVEAGQKCVPAKEEVPIYPKVVPSAQTTSMQALPLMPRSATDQKSFIAPVQNQSAVPQSIPPALTPAVPNSCTVGSVSNSVRPPADSAGSSNALPNSFPEVTTTIKRVVDAPAEAIIGTSASAILVAHARKYALGEVKVKHINGCNPRYLVLVTVGGEKYTSYGEKEFNSFEEAEVVACQRAMEGTKERILAPSSSSLTGNASYSGTSVLPKTSTTELLLKQLKSLLSKHSRGVFKTNLERDYAIMFKEDLPDNWIDVISKSSGFSVIAAAANICVINYIPQDHGGSGEPDATDRLPPQLEVPPPSETSDSGYDVLVTEMISGCEVAIRFVGKDHNDKLADLIKEMEMCYLGAVEGNGEGYLVPMTVEELVEHDPYIIVECQTCYRVVLVRVGDGEGGGEESSIKCLCYLVDHGSVEEFSVSQLRRIQGKFLRLPYQAVKFHLYGLSWFADSSIAQTALAEYGKLYRSLLAMPQPGNEYLINEGGEEDEVTCVSLIDTSGTEDVHVNGKIITKILTSLLAHNPLLTTMDDTECILLNAQSDGRIYIRTCKGLSAHVDMLVDYVASSMDDNAMPVDQVAMGGVYLAFYLTKDDEEKPCRVTPTTINPDRSGKITMFAMDLGKWLDLSLGEIYPLVDLDYPINPAVNCPLPVMGTKLASIPAQAIECQISGNRCISPCISLEHFWNVFDKEESVLIKAVSLGNAAANGATTAPVPEVILKKIVSQNDAHLNM